MKKVQFVLLYYSLVPVEGITIYTWLDVVACTCNPATFEAEFGNGVGSIPVLGNSPSIGGWIV